MTEAAIISAMQQGDEAAFKEAVNQWQSLVYTTALSMLQHEHDADDVTQDVFITVFEQIKHYRSEAAFSTWLYRITINKCLDFKRRQKNVFFFNGNSDETPEQFVFHHPGIQLEQKENAARLFAALRTLPPAQQAAFILQRAEGLAVKDIADILKTSVTAAESLLNRAKRNLAEKLNLK